MNNHYFLPPKFSSLLKVSLGFVMIVLVLVVVSFLLGAKIINPQTGSSVQHPSRVFDVQQISPSPIPSGYLPYSNRNRPDTLINIRGHITAKHHPTSEAQNRGFIGSIFVESILAANETADGNAYGVGITEETRIFKEYEQSRDLVTFESLQVGQQVEAQLTELNESDPPSGTAYVIIIVNRNM